MPDACFFIFIFFRLIFRSTLWRAGIITGFTDEETDVRCYKRDGRCEVEFWTLKSL